MSKRREATVEPVEDAAEEVLAHRELPVEPDPQASDDHEWHEYGRPTVKARQVMEKTFCGGAFAMPGDWIFYTDDGAAVIMSDKKFRANFIRLPEEGE